MLEIASLGVLRVLFLLVGSNFEKKHCLPLRPPVTCAAQHEVTTVTFSCSKCSAECFQLAVNNGISAEHGREKEVDREDRCRQVLHLRPELARHPDHALFF